MTPVQMIAIFAALATGVAVLRANTKRPVNIAFFILSVMAVAWVATLAQLRPETPNLLFWIRLANAEAALLPWTFWVLKQTVLLEQIRLRTFVKGWPWAVITAGLVVLTFSDYFIPSDSTPLKMRVGPGRPIFNGVIAAEYIWLLVQTIREMRVTKGIRRLELQFIMFNGAGAGLCAVVMNAVSVWLKLPVLRRAEPLVIVAFYMVAAWAITSGKVFDARQLFRFAMRRFFYVIVVGVALAIIQMVSDDWSKWFTVAVMALVVVVLLEWMKGRLDATAGDTDASGVRRRLLATSREVLDWQELERKISEILCNWASCERAHILVGSYEAHDSTQLPQLSEFEEAELARQVWVTPEKLERELVSPEKSALDAYLRGNRLGLLVAGPATPASIPVAIAMGIRGDRRPFTWNEVQLVREWASIIEGCISRLNLSQQARDAEQLATAGLLGASLAHEIRNPLVTIKSVLQSDPSRRDAPEFKRLMFEVMPGEVQRIETMVTGLMDLGKPKDIKFEGVSLHEIVQGTIKLATPKARQNFVVIRQQLDAAPDVLHADGNSLRVLTLNLVMNAIDALKGQQEGVVTVRTRSTPEALILEISDNGPGLPVEVRRTLFRPFTKSSKTSGMGLGLAICADTVRAHRGKIELLDTEGEGTAFRVSLPWQQPSF